MVFAEILEKALKPGIIKVKGPKVVITAHVKRTGELGVEFDKLEVSGSGESLLNQIEKAKDLNILGEQLVLFELAEELEGAILRTKSSDIKSGFWQVEIRPDTITINRFSLKEGDREKIPFTLTREQFRNLVDDLEQPFLAKLEPRSNRFE